MNDRSGWAHVLPPPKPAQPKRDPAADYEPEAAAEQLEARQAQTDAIYDPSAEWLDREPPADLVPRRRKRHTWGVKR